MTNQPVGIPYQVPTKYVGPDMNIIPIKRFPRSPLTTDKKYRVGQTAILGKNPSTGTEGDLWYLARFESNGDATWLQLATGASSPGIDFLLTDDGAPAVGPDGSGIVTVAGGTGIVTSGQDPSTTVTIAVDGGVVGQTITGDSGGALSPTGGNWNIIGSTGLNTSGAGSTLTINLDGSVVTTQYDGDTGSATPSSGILNIIGGNGTVTSASGNTVVAEMESPFVGDFSFESNTGGAVETLTVQNTVDAASSASVLETKVAGTSSDYAMIRASVDGSESYGFSLNPSSSVFSLFYDDSDSVTPSSAVITPLIIDSINTSALTSRMLVNTSLFVTAEGTNDAQLRVFGAFTTGNVTVALQKAGDGNAGSAKISYNMIPNNWNIGIDDTQNNDLFITQAVASSWPPSSSNTLIHIENALTGSSMFDQTGAIVVPRGTTGERPGTPVNGMIRYNTTTAKFEGYEAGAWANLI